MNTPSCPPAETDPNAVGTPHHTTPRHARPGWWTRPIRRGCRTRPLGLSVTSAVCLLAAALVIISAVPR